MARGDFTVLLAQPDGGLYRVEFAADQVDAKQLMSEYHAAIREAHQTGDVSELRRFRGSSVEDRYGYRWRLVTDIDALDDADDRAGIPWSEYWHSE